MKTFSIIILVFLILISVVFGQEQNDTYGKPLIVLTETNPWLMAIGSDVPSFALYEKNK